MGIRVVKNQKKKNTRKRDPEIIKRDAKESGEDKWTHVCENRRVLGRLWGLGG